MSSRDHFSDYGFDSHHDLCSKCHPKLSLKQKQKRLAKKFREGKR